MGLIREYQNWDPDWNKTFEFLQKHHLLEKLYYSLDSPDPLRALFGFSLEFGIQPILEFIYEVQNYRYNFKMLEPYMPTIKPTAKEENNKIAIQTGNQKIGLKLQFQDQYSQRRQDCVRYLLRMRKYSKYTYENGNFYYQYNKK